VDACVRRVLEVKLRLGLFDPPEKVRYAQIPYSVNQSAEHDRLARRMAQESIVLLKNDGLLPLSRDKKVAVVGPNADEVMTLLGNYYGTPAAPVTVLAGIRNALAPAPVLFARGADLVEGRQDPRAIQAIDAAYLASEGKAGGLRAEYFRGRPGVEVMWTSAGEGEGSPIPFYERYGFEGTGEIVFDDEVLLRLRL